MIVKSKCTSNILLTMDYHDTGIYELRIGLVSFLEYERDQNHLRNFYQYMNFLYAKLEELNFDYHVLFAGVRNTTIEIYSSTTADFLYDNIDAHFIEAKLRSC